VEEKRDVFNEPALGNTQLSLNSLSIKHRLIDATCNVISPTFRIFADINVGIDTVKAADYNVDHEKLHIAGVRLSF